MARSKWVEVEVKPVGALVPVSTPEPADIATEMTKAMAELAALRLEQTKEQHRQDLLAGKTTLANLGAGSAAHDRSLSEQRAQLAAQLKEAQRQLEMVKAGKEVAFRVIVPSGEQTKPKLHRNIVALFSIADVDRLLRAMRVYESMMGLNGHNSVDSVQQEQQSKRKRLTTYLVECVMEGGGYPLSAAPDWYAEGRDCPRDWDYMAWAAERDGFDPSTIND